MNLGTVDISDATMENLDITEPAGTMVIIPNDYSEIDVFCLMLARFGHPNGPMTMSIPDGDPNAPFKWDFIFNIPNFGTLEICRSWMHLEIRTRKITAPPKELLGFLQYNLDAHKDKIENVKGKIEDYRLLINPFKRHQLLANESKEELDNFTIKKIYYPKGMAATEKQIKRHNKSFDNYMKGMNKESSLSISLCTHSAFMVEAYLNLILAVFLKKDIREDSAIFKETIERPWRKKIKRLHVDCNHISKVDFGDSIIRDISKVFDLRNKVAHSYPHKEDLTVSNMWFFKNFPILENPLPFDKFQIAANNSLPTKTEAIFCFETANKMIELIDRYITTSNLEGFKMLSNSNPIGFNEKKGVYSLPFGSVVSKVFFPS